MARMKVDETFSHFQTLIWKGVFNLLSIYDLTIFFNVYLKSGKQSINREVRLNIPPILTEQCCTKIKVAPILILHLVLENDLTF